MNKRSNLKNLKNRCISCAYLYTFVQRLSDTLVEDLTDAQRIEFLNYDYDNQPLTNPPRLRCYKEWNLPGNLANVVQAKCKSGEWKTHQDGIHPEMVERDRIRHKEKIDRWLLIIGVIPYGYNSLYYCL